MKINEKNNYFFMKMDFLPYIHKCAEKYQLKAYPSVYCEIGRYLDCFLSNFLERLKNSSVENAIRASSYGEITKHGLSEAKKFLEMLKKLKENVPHREIAKYGPNISMRFLQEKRYILLPLSLLKSKISIFTNDTLISMSKEFLTYLSGYIEYVTVELLEISGIVTSGKGREIIKVKDFKKAVDEDEEMKANFELFSQSSIIYSDLTGVIATVEGEEVGDLSFDDDEDYINEMNRKYEEYISNIGEERHEEENDESSNDSDDEEDEEEVGEKRKYEGEDEMIPDWLEEMIYEKSCNGGKSYDYYIEQLELYIEKRMLGR